MSLEYTSQFFCSAAVLPFVGSSLCYPVLWHVLPDPNVGRGEIMDAVKAWSMKVCLYIRKNPPDSNKQHVFLALEAH